MARESKDKVGATPGKLALVALLAVVLVGVVAANWSGAEPPPGKKDATKGKRPSPAAQAAAAATPGAAAAGPFGEFAQDEHWPKLPLSEVTKFDPLAKSPWARPVVSAETAVQSETQITELLAAKNAIIFMSGDKRVARIGDNEYRVGDVIGRFEITDITPQGLKLSEVR